MQLNLLKPRKSLNKAFLKLKPTRIQIDSFKANLEVLISQTNEKESEEFHKNLLSHFLKKTYYDPDYFINTKERNDLVIHNGKTANTTVAVIIETKKPTNKAEMLREDNINSKAFHELILYYLRERINHNNLEIKHIIATNIYEWFIFDASLFEKLFAQNKELVKKFNDFENHRLSGSKTDFFYKNIAETFVQNIESEISFTYFDIRNYHKTEDSKLIALFKILSPEHLLKLPFLNDSNTLDKKFYNELLHIIGLEEKKIKNKKLIKRKESHDDGSLLENTITQLETKDKIPRLNNPRHFGDDKNERLLNVGLELVITWINRILFLKLLEAQLLKYHKASKEYAFLNIKKIKNYDDLEFLFLSVLARKYSDRDGEAITTFKHVPYLNSSLFELTNLEHATISISNLRDDRKLPISSDTVLKNSTGKKLTGELNAIEYLFKFLDAYDFSSEGSEDIQEEGKTLINASVLGLIFEKINGYKDGSFFTPGFITMYMCSETIRRAIVQKFNDIKNWNCTSIDELYNKIEDKKEANEIINSIRICDPAVGSGHFLVSALNEILAIKNYLDILCDHNGKRLKNYHIEVVNDELIVTDEDGELFEYNFQNQESQRIQETLFHEKETLIENCLFGVDINHNSVKICRLRLWIELLKNTYYKTDSEPRELETLPNIDINIKCGNSLISRYPLDADIKKALRKSKWNISGYRDAVMMYRNAKSKEEKKAHEEIIETIKSDFETDIIINDKNHKDLKKYHKQLSELQYPHFNIETEKEKKERFKKIRELLPKIEKIEKRRAEIKNNRIYKNAFEWRFEFPEVLNDDGEFIGFDVIIGNPPYIRQEELKEFKGNFQSKFKTYAGTADLFVYFVELGMGNLKQNGEFTFIIPNKWMRAGYGKALRNYIKENRIHSIIDFGDLPVFEEATTYPCILSLSKTKPQDTFQAVNIETLQFDEGLNNYISENKLKVIVSELPEAGWTLSDSKVQNLLSKLRSKGKPLEEYVEGKIFRGIITGLNKAFVIDEETKNKLIAEDAKSAEIIKPFLAGRDIKRYQQPIGEKYLILIKSGDTKYWFGNLDEAHAWKKLNEKYPSICEFLLPHEKKGKARCDQGQYWWELRACDYYEEFEKKKIIYPNILKKPEFLLDTNSFYANQKCFIITKFNLTFLGILNSSLNHFLFKSTLPMLRGNFYEPSYIFFKDFPIVERESEMIESRVTQIINIKKANPDADTTELEYQIDQTVYELYGLTEEEIKIVEGAN